MQNIENLKQNSYGVESNSFDDEWISYLCSLGNRLEYQQIAVKSKNAMFAIMKYRRLLRSRGLGNISFIMLNTAYTTKNYTKLHSLLQELFLESISDNHFSFILDRMQKTEDAMLKVYERHMQDTGTRILSVMLTL